MRDPLRRPLCMFVAAAILAASAPAGAQEDRVLPLEGQWVAGRIEQIDGDTLRLAGGRQFDLQRLQRIERPGKTIAPAPAVLVHLIDGGIIRAADVTLDSEGCRIQCPAAAPIKLPLSAIRGIRLARGADGKADAAPMPEFDKALAGTSKQDALYVIAEGQAQAIEGGLERIDPDHVTFSWGGTARKMARSRAYGVTLATLAKPPELSGMCQVRLVDGSALWGRVSRFKEPKLFLRAHDTEIALPWDQVAQVRIRSDRVTFLSDLDPLEVVEEALVAFAGPWRRDRNVLGGPLTLGSAVYERGLGVHSRCVLAYDCGGRYAAFAATIGIDAQTRGRGDCVFKVIGDGKDLFSKQVKGTDKPCPVRLDIRGIKRLALAVEPGDGLDLADHGDWCEARLEKPDPAPR